MITDKIDGDIARKHNLVTNFGKIADPIADKAMTGMAFIGLSIVGDVWWWVTIVVLLREWAVTLLRLSILKHVVIAAAAERQGQDRPPGRRADRPAACHCASWTSTTATTPGEVLFYAFQAMPRRGRGDDPVVRLRVLPRRVAAARVHPRHVTFTGTPHPAGASGPHAY